MPEDPGLPDAEGRSPTVNVLASRAAAAALSGPQVTPGQWVYRSCAVVATPDNASSPVIVERWATADNTVAAAYQDGQLEVGPWIWPVDPQGNVRRRPLMQPAVSYSALNSLPGTPDGPRGLLAETPVPGRSGGTQDSLRADRRALPDIRHATGDRRAALPGPRCDHRRDSQPARHRRGRTSPHRLCCRHLAKPEISPTQTPGKSRGTSSLAMDGTSGHPAHGAWPYSARRSSPRRERARLSSPHPATYDGHLRRKHAILSAARCGWSWWLGISCRSIRSW